MKIKMKLLLISFGENDFTKSTYHTSTNMSVLQTVPVR